MLKSARFGQLPSFLILLGVLLFAVACNEDEGTPQTNPTDNALSGLDLPETPYNYSDITLPHHFRVNAFPARYRFQFAAVESDNTPSDNPTTDAGATLGRVLFYEKMLSANSTIACASCHKQELGFSDNEVLSLGFEGGKTRRHSMGLANARFYDTGKFFWDERAGSLEEQVLMPFQDEVEMGLTLDDVVRIVSEQPYSSTLFTNAFGDDMITADRIAKALAQFIRSMVSFQAKYDLGRSQVASPLDDFPNFTEEENLGKELFYATNLVAPSCASCHMSEAFVAPLLAENGSTIATNNGLDAQSTDDQGVYESTLVNGHRGKFKVPSLRNIAVRPPYMHDGRFSSLEEVIDHYSTGIQNHPTLQPFLRDNTTNEPVRFNFTPEQKSALVAFLKTLTDEDFLTETKFSDPFR
ncbi:MAG: cytochrome-c peroxidase [Bacteroidia bacterium]|nr:cytochrome-c peroxidase [Bacteroidia bacterium]